MKRVRGGFFFFLEIDFALFDEGHDGRYNSDGRVSYNGFNVVPFASAAKGPSMIFYTGLGTRILERVKEECGHDTEVGHVLCQSLRCARDFEKHKNIRMKL